MLMRRVLVGLAGLFAACLAHAQTVESPRFSVKSFNIEGDVPIPRERALAIVAPYAGDAVELERLQAAATALEEELFSQGYSFYRVVLPPQDLTGVVTLRVLPFRLQNVSVTGNQYFSTANILAMLPALKAGGSPNVAEVGRQRAAANEHPSKEIEVTFRQSETPDAVDAVVAVTDQKPFSVFLAVNNIGDHQTGKWRTTLGLQHSNLWGRDHSVTASYTTAPENPADVKQYGLYYRIPFYSISGALTLFYAYSDVNSGTIANAFEVSGRGRFSGVHWRQHLVPHGAYSHAIEAGLDDRFFDNNVTFGTTPIGVDVRSRPITFSYYGRLDRAESAIAANVQYARNVGGGSENNDVAYTGNRAGATPNWQAVRMSVDGSWRVAPIIFSVRLRGQLADEALIPGEQFGLGGAMSVRGLREREVTGDSGYTATAEALLPLPMEGWSAVAFVDGGRVKLKTAIPGQPSHQDAASAGVGMRYTLARRFALSIDAAQVIDGTTVTQARDRRVHVSLVYRF